MAFNDGQYILKNMINICANKRRISVQSKIKNILKIKPIDTVEVGSLLTPKQNKLNSVFHNS